MFKIIRLALYRDIYVGNQIHVDYYVAVIFRDDQGMIQLKEFGFSDSGIEQFWFFLIKTMNDKNFLQGTSN